jgi:hypothetical protein
MADGTFATIHTAKAVTIIFFVENRCRSQLQVNVMIRPGGGAV